MKYTLLTLFSFFLSVVTLAQSSLTLRPASNGKDASVWSNGATRNYGSANAINVYTWTNSGNLGVKRAYLEFDLSQLPASANIDSAHLSLYYLSSGNNEGYFVHTGANEMWLERVSSSWHEDSITWNNQPTRDSINRVHIDSSTNGTQDYTDIDVTNLIIDILNPTNNNYGFALKMKDEINYYRGVLLASSDHIDSTLHPKLEIYYNTNPICNSDFSFYVDSTNTVEFTALSNNTGNKYSWDFGDSNTDTSANPIHTYATTGNYLTTLTVINSNGDTCSTSDSILVNICSSDFTFSIGSKGEVTFTNNSTSSAIGTSYSWSFGDSSTSNIKNPIHTYSSSGTYYISLSINDSINNCSSTWSDSLVLIYNDTNCTAKFTIEKDSSTQYNIILYNISTNASSHSYLWDFGDGTTGSGRTPIHIYQSFGLFEVCLTVTDSILKCDTAFFCDTVGMDSLGNLKAGFGIEVRDRVLVGLENDEKPLSEFMIYPNPSNGIMRIELLNSSLKLNNNAINVLNLSGQLVPFSINASTFSLDISKNPPGLYFVRITHENGVYTQKVILR